MPCKSEIMTDLRIMTLSQLSAEIVHVQDIAPKGNIHRKGIILIIKIKLKKIKIIRLSRRPS